MPEHRKYEKRIVHLGNIGDSHVPEREKAARTREQAKIFPEHKFIGIDIRGLNHWRTMENWEQKIRTFNKGLAEEENKSLDEIYSEMAIGYYGYAQWPLEIAKPEHPETYSYTYGTIHLAHEKLKPGGQMIIVIADDVLKNLENILNKSPFKGKFTKRRIPKKEREKGSYWMRNYDRGLLNLYEITATK